MIENLRKSIGYLLLRQGARGLQLLTRVLIYFTANGVSQVKLLIDFRTAAIKWAVIILTSR